jgi:hypothetical protein
MEETRIISATDTQKLADQFLSISQIVFILTEFQILLIKTIENLQRNLYNLVVITPGANTAIE